MTVAMWIGKWTLLSLTFFKRDPEPEPDAVYGAEPGIAAIIGADDSDLTWSRPERVGFVARS